MKAALAVAVILDVGVLIFTLRDRSAKFFWLRLACAAAGILFALPGLLL
jgi:hypothetical protein